MDKSVHRFAEVAAEYCRWAEGTASGEAADASMARGLLVNLYRLALELPDAWSEKESPGISDEQYKAVYRRFGSLPFNYYSECFNPLMVPSEEPVVADLADDLADVWRDLKAGLLLFNAGEIEAAAWEWRFRFGAHWGHHAIAALYALHAWFSSLAEEPAHVID